MRHKKYILSISGQDPTNGAGNSLDILVANQHNFHCLSSITNLTIQDAEKLHKVEDVNENFFRKTLSKNSSQKICFGTYFSKTMLFEKKKSFSKKQGRGHMCVCLDLI